MALLLRRLCLNGWSVAATNTVFRRSSTGSLHPLLWASTLHVSGSSHTYCSTTDTINRVQPGSRTHLSRPLTSRSWLRQQVRRYTAENAAALEKVNEEIASKPASSKIFAIVHISGRQFKITPNDLIVVNKVPADIGSEIYLEKVLLAGSENFTLIGKPLLSSDTVRVKATVTEHTKTAKVIVFKKKRRTNYKRKRGHRQDVSILRINDILLTPNLR